MFAVDEELVDSEIGWSAGEKGLTTRRFRPHRFAIRGQRDSSDSSGTQSVQANRPDAHSGMVWAIRGCQRRKEKKKDGRWRSDYDWTRRL